MPKKAPEHNATSDANEKALIKVSHLCVQTTTLCARFLRCRVF